VIAKDLSEQIGNGVRAAEDLKVEPEINTGGPYSLIVTVRNYPQPLIHNPVDIFSRTIVHNVIHNLLISLCITLSTAPPRTYPQDTE